MNEAQVTIVGYIASTPNLVMTKAGRFVANMRVGVTPRRQDRDTGQWSDGDSSYVTVTCWRSLATNVAACLRKGDPVVVKGKMRVREFDDRDGKRRTVVEVDATTLGHDLTRGVAHFLRTKRSPGDAPALQLSGRFAGGDPARPGVPGPVRAGQAADGWEDQAMPEMPEEAGGVAEEEEAEPERTPDHDFSAADLFDDAGITTSQAGLADAGHGAGTDGTEELDQADPGVRSGAQETSSGGRDVGRAA